MAGTHKPSKNGRQQTQRSNQESMRWVIGLLVAFIGLFGAAALFFFVV